MALLFFKQNPIESNHRRIKAHLPVQCTHTRKAYPKLFNIYKSVMHLSRGYIIRQQLRRYPSLIISCQSKNQIKSNQNHETKN